MAVKHMVAFEFRPDATSAEIARIMQALRELVGVVPGLLDFQGGVYSGPYPGATDLNKRYTHGFVMTFRDAKSRAAYLPHPAHVRFKDELLLPHLQDVVAFDFETGAQS